MLCENVQLRQADGILMTNENSISQNREAGAVFLGDVSVSDARLILIPSVWNLRISMAAGLYALLGICVLHFAADERIRKRLVLFAAAIRSVPKSVARPHLDTFISRFRRNFTSLLRESHSRKAFIIPNNFIAGKQECVKQNYSSKISCEICQEYLMSLRPLYSISSRCLVYI